MTNRRILSTRKKFENHECNLLHKWVHYFEIYDFHFKDYINKEIVILEINVTQGVSIEFWKSFFGLILNILEKILTRNVWNLNKKM